MPGNGRGCGPNGPGGRRWPAAAPICLHHGYVWASNPPIGSAPMARVKRQILGYNTKQERTDGTVHRTGLPGAGTPAVRGMAAKSWSGGSLGVVRGVRRRQVQAARAAARDEAGVRRSRADRRDGGARARGRPDRAQPRENALPRSGRCATRPAGGSAALQIIA